MNLWLLRHAKAVPHAPAGGADHERPLAPKGRRDADALGRRLGGDRLGFAPDDLPGLVLCSTAVRTRQTAERVVAGLAPIDHRSALYGASPEQVLGEVRTVDDDIRTVMVVGHNPTTQVLARAMDRTPVAHRSFPTCAVAVYRLPATRWCDVAEGTGTLLGWFTPPY